jgi:hypothetical protein
MVMGKCTEYQIHKTDMEIKSENYKCFVERILNVKDSGRYIPCDQNIYTDEMSKSEKYEALAHCKRMKELIANRSYIKDNNIIKENQS